MDAFWLTFYLVSAGLVIVQSLLLALQTWEHCRYVRSCMRSAIHRKATGRAAVFAPCKGVDIDLEANLKALLEQDYDDYEIVFVVENFADPAYVAIRQAIAEHPRVPARVIVAGRATDSGQKVHNLRVATEHISSRVKYLAFVDSDAQPSAHWLRSLVAHLDQSELGAVTGYRWFTPVKASVANALVYSMNCDVLSLLTRSSHHLIWGGSWAIRREVFDQLGLHDAWQGTLSDDLVACRLMRRAKLGVRFEPACVVASSLDATLASAMSFIRRQYVIARLYTFDWWLFSMVAAMFSNLIWLGNLGVLAISLFTGSPSPWIPVAVSTALYAIMVYRGWLRQGLVKVYFPDWESESHAIQRFDIWANPLVELAHWIGVSSAAVGRSILWRGIRYRVAPGGAVQEIVHAAAEPQAAEEEEPMRYRIAG